MAQRHTGPGRYPRRANIKAEANADDGLVAPPTLSPHLVAARHAKRLDDGLAVVRLGRALVVGAAVQHNVAGRAHHLRRLGAAVGCAQGVGQAERE
eukprot:361054-Chlamydomonas_euryale.AAC.3